MWLAVVYLSIASFIVCMGFFFSSFASCVYVLAGSAMLLFAEFCEQTASLARETSDGKRSHVYASNVGNVHLSLLPFSLN